MDTMAIRVLRMALQLLSDRVLTILSLLMSFGLACWVMRYPDHERIFMAGFFCLVVFVPTLVRERRQTKEKPDDQE